MINCEALHVDVLWASGDRVEGTLDTVTRTTFVRFPLKQAMTWGCSRSRCSKVFPRQRAYINSPGCHGPPLGSPSVVLVGHAQKTSLA